MGRMKRPHLAALGLLVLVAAGVVVSRPRPGKEGFTALPLDPCSGQPFVYRREGGGFLLYSVGTDGADPGGLSTENDVIFRAPR